MCIRDRDAAVVGLKCKGGGEMVVAAVIPVEGYAIDEQEIRDYCYGQLTRYKVPRRVFEVEDFPRSMLGKTLRREVRKKLEQEHGE